MAELTRGTRRGIVAGSALAALLVGVWGPSLADQEAAPSFADQEPAPSDAVCPRIHDDYVLCSSNTWSGNCAAFVDAAEALAKLYRKRAAEHPEWQSRLMTTVWWGCGSANIGDITMLLERLHSDRARKLLRVEPYASVPLEPLEPVGAAAPARVSCENLPGALDRIVCAERELEAAEAAHRRVYQACKQTVSADARERLTSAESTWRRNRGAECKAEGAADRSASRFAVTRCLARTATQRTRSMLENHPECARSR